MRKIRNWIYKDLQTVVSTNDEAKLSVLTEKQNCIVSAIEQTGGRGRRGRQWISQDGNLFVSYAFKIKPSDLNRIVILSAVTIFETIKHFVPNHDVKIKWPNDVLVDDKKISGILFEKVDDDFWVMGVGINVMSNPEHTDLVYPTTSLKNLGIDTNRIAVLEYLTDMFDNLLDTYYNDGFENIRQTWLKNAYNLGKHVIIKQENKIQEGIFWTIDKNGALILKNNDNMEKILAGDLFVKEAEDDRN